MTFKATDRCDRCMAQAVASVDAPHWLSKLLLCLHHAREHRVAIESAGAILYVEDGELEWTQ